MTTLNNDTMDYTGTESLLRLLLIEKNLSSTLRRKINEKATNFLEDLTDDVGGFLHMVLGGFVDGLADEEHTCSDDDIKTLVQCVPGTLSLKDECGHFPIHSASLSWGKRVSFVPMLAEEGIKHNVGGDGMRGGLLCEFEENGTILTEIACNNPYQCATTQTNTDYAKSDLRRLDVIKRLREMGLLKKEDIRKYDLLWDSCNDCSSQRFNYFADWDPSILKEQQWDRCFATPWALRYRYSAFQLALSATLRHYPRELGLLLLKDDEGETSFQTTRNEFGKEKAWKAIKKCLDESDGSSNILEKNSESNMYPFMFAAADSDTSELDLVYYLVRRNPLSLLSDYCSGKNTATDMMCSGKRKR
jgi:hypothetical protein